MKPANHRNLDDFPLVRRFDFPGIRGILFQRQMCSAIVIVNEILSKDSAQVVLANNDHVFGAVPAKGADQAFRIWILPGRSWSSFHFFDAI